MFKNHITTISPFVEVKKGFPTLNKFVLNKEEVIIPNKYGSIPIYQDKIKFINKEIENKQENIIEDKDEKVEVKSYEASKYIEFSSYELKNPIEKLLNIEIIGFRNLSNELIEQILNILINEDEIKEKSDYRWSSIDDVDNKIIFLKFLNDELNNIKRLKKLIEFNIKLDDKMIISTNHGLKQYLKDVLNEFKFEINNEVIQEKINNLIKLNKSIKHVLKDENDYVIDDEQFQDIPIDVLPQLKKDIKDFRLKVFEIERKKREKEQQEEIKRSKIQMRKLFVNAKKDEESDDEEEEEEDDGLTDEKFEELRLEKIKTTIMRNYTIKLVSIKAIESHNLELIELEQNLVNYEQNLDQSIKPEYELGKFKSYGINRDVEIEKDETDRNNYVEIVEEKENVKINISIKQNLEVSDEKLLNALESIKSKIESYLEELLGVGDEELTEYIVMTIQENKNKSALIEELKETLDEDAEKIGDLIWKDLVEALKI